MADPFVADFLVNLAADCHCGTLPRMDVQTAQFAVIGIGLVIVIVCLLVASKELR